MLVYCALTSEFGIRLNAVKKMKLPKFNILLSYYYFPKDLKKYLTLTNNVLIDSGAFTFQRTGLDKIKEYTENYIKFIKKYTDNPKLNGFIELDIDNKIGYDKVLKIREQLEEHSDKIIPVWHKALGIKEFKKMCNEYDYVAVSGFANEDIKSDQLIYFVKYAHKHNSKIHGLGLARTKILDYVPFDSVDASSWMKVNRYGHYRSKKLNSKYISNNGEKTLLVELIDQIELQYKYYNKYKSYHKDTM